MRGEGRGLLDLGGAIERREGIRRQADRNSNVTDAPKLPAWARNGTEYASPGTSIFDPVLCEVVYRWFCVPGGKVLNPMAGESSYGLVAAYLGYDYMGVEIRPEQVASNREQARAMKLRPRWIVGDGRDCATLAPGEYDLVFCCPPYADLEVYSDNPADLSTMDYPQFLEAYRAIVAASIKMLKPDRFACFVVSEVRDKAGRCRHFVADTVQAFVDAGLCLYNEAVLVNAYGSLSIRAGKQFQSGRKLGRTHQNVLVFYNGNPANIADNFGEVQCGELSQDV